ncbi:small, acid-soluble spore protein, alpha/beta type [Clostridium sp. D5]|nr:small, acid-soluble spore protein, alpha/beta type [Clostridium sp. D5]
MRNITVYEDNRVGIQSIRLVINIQNSTAFGGYMVKKMIEQQERQMAGK